MAVINDFESFSSSKIKDLISSCNASSDNLHKLLPVKINEHTIMALVDSANSFYNVLSLSVAKQMNLRDYKPYTGSPVGTASIGSSIDIVGVIPSITFYLRDESGKEHGMSSRLVIVKHLSCGLNISLPFMVEHGLSQLHPQGVLFQESQNLRFPLYRNINHARRRLKDEEVPSQINVIVAAPKPRRRLKAADKMNNRKSDRVIVSERVLYSETDKGIEKRERE